MERREFLGTSVLAGVSAATAAAVPSPADATSNFRYCLNTATLQGFKLGIVQLVETAAKAGYGAVEPWLSDLNAYVQQGGSLAELRRRIADLGLTVESAISFPQWVVDDGARRAAALDQVKREMDVVSQIGGKRIAAPPAGANNGPELGVKEIAERYRAVLELGDRADVVPEL